MKKLLLIMLSVIFLFGCTPYSPDYYPEEDLIVYPMRNAIFYEYQEKVAIQIRCSSEKTDSLSLRISETSDGWMSGFDSYSILNGKFEKVGWYDDNLFILMDEIYYSFDIDKYEVPNLDDEGYYQEPVYELIEYSKTEFIKAYPDYNSFDWYGH